MPASTDKKKKQVLIAQSHLQWFWVGCRCERTEKAAWVKECSGQSCRSHKTFSSTCFLSEAVLEYKLTLCASYSLLTAPVKYCMDMQIKYLQSLLLQPLQQKGVYYGCDTDVFACSLFLNVVPHTYSISMFLMCRLFFHAIFLECEDTAILFAGVNNSTR